jgi:hypothetical protein
MLFGGLNGAVVKCQTPQIAIDGYGQNTNTPGFVNTLNYVARMFKKVRAGESSC